MSEHDTVTGLADRLAIQDLVVQYAKARDTTDPDLYRQIFTEDAVIQLEGGPVLSNGLEAILAKVASDQTRFNPDSARGVNSYAIMRHEVGNVTITVSGDSASSDYYINTLAYNEAAKRPEILACGRNEDEYVRRGGRWRISRSTMIFGWANEELGKALQVGPYTPPEYLPPTAGTTDVEGA